MDVLIGFQGPEAGQKAQICTGMENTKESRYWQDGSCWEGPHLLSSQTLWSPEQCFSNLQGDPAVLAIRKTAWRELSNVSEGL